MAINKNLIAGFLLLALGLTASSAPAREPVSWTSAESNSRLSRAENKPFFIIANQFESQINKFYCGPASAVIVLNALRSHDSSVKKPSDVKLYRGPQTPLLKLINPVFERYTQDAFFNEKTDRIKTQDQVFGVPVNPKDPKDPKTRDGGIQLRQLGEMLKTYQLDVAIHVVSDDDNEQKVKNDLIANLKKEAHFIIVNFQRKALGEIGGAHISPLGAYDPVSDSVLIMDVNPTDQSWVWVKIDRLIKAMQTKDTIENRGYLVVSETLNKQE